MSTLFSSWLRESQCPSGVVYNEIARYAVKERDPMQIQFLGFGAVEIDGERYDKDVVIDKGVVRKRDKKPSKALNRPGHTPLSAAEAIPWNCTTLIIGMGVVGALPVLDDVYTEAKRRDVTIVTMTTPEACERLTAADLSTTNAILHLTC